MFVFLALCPHLGNFEKQGRQCKQTRSVVIGDCKMGQTGRVEYGCQLQREIIRFMNEKVHYKIVYDYTSWMIIFKISLLSSSMDVQ